MSDADAPTDARTAAANIPAATLVQALILSLSLAAAAYLAVRLFRPPAALPADAAPQLFSAARAQKHLFTLARAPHPVGSAEHGAVRDYIFAELRGLGLEPEIQTTTAVGQSQAVPQRVGRVQNIAGRLRGTANTKAVALVAHYDSVPTGPGANDDGAAVAALLETARALKAGAPLKNDVILLFTDAEEAGLLGAQAFTAEHPWARDIGVLFNFEARGGGGASIMFETSADNGWLIDEYAGAATHPIASSLFYEIYKLLPNDTDLTVFRRAGLAGLNFAYLENFDRYHTAADNAGNVSPDTLQHHGDNSLSMARRFGALDIGQTRAPNAVYFNPLGATLVHYPGWLVLPLSLLLLAVFVFVAVVGFRRRVLKPGRLALGFLAVLLGVVATAVTATAALKLADLLQRGEEFAPWGEPYNAKLYAAGFACLTCAVVWALGNWFLRRAGVYNLALGGLLLWLLLALAVALLMPGASYLFLWPLLFALVGLALLLTRPGLNPAGRLLVLTLCALPVVLLFPPLLYMLFVALTYKAAALILPLLALALGLLWPQFAYLSGRRRWLLPAVALGAGAAFIAAGVLTAGYDGNHPKVNSVFYGLNADTGRAVWASPDAQPDEWTGQFFAAAGPRAPLPEFAFNAPISFHQAEAPNAPLPPPAVSVLDDRTSDGVRTLRLRLASPRGAQNFTLLPESQDFVLVGATLDGKAIPLAGPAGAQSARDPWRIQYFGFPPEGAELTLSFRSSQPLRVRATDRSYGLPQLPGTAVRPRPADAMPAPHPFSDVTVVTKTYSF